MRKFKQADGSDYDYQIEQRVITGRLTPKRYKCLTKYVRAFNRKVAFPYGISPNGYAYSCGCEHDCCGCLCSERMEIEFKKEFNSENFKVILTHSQSFNY
jgi:hypothetical protein